MENEKEAYEITGDCPYCTVAEDGTIRAEVITVKGVDNLSMIVDASNGVLQIGIVTEPDTMARQLFKHRSVVFSTNAKYCPYCGKKLNWIDNEDYEYIIGDIVDDTEYDDTPDDNEYADNSYDDTGYDDTLDDNDFVVDELPEVEVINGVEITHKGMSETAYEDGTYINPDGDSEIEVGNLSHNLPKHIDIESEVNDVLMAMGVDPFEIDGIDFDTGDNDDI